MAKSTLTRFILGLKVDALTSVKSNCGAFLLVSLHKLLSTYQCRDKKGFGSESGEADGLPPQKHYQNLIYLSGFTPIA